MLQSDVFDTSTTGLRCRNCLVDLNPKSESESNISVPLFSEGLDWQMSRFKFCGLSCAKGYVLFVLQRENSLSNTLFTAYLKSTMPCLSLEDIQKIPAKSPEAVDLCLFGPEERPSPGSDCRAWACRNCGHVESDGSTVPWLFSLFEHLKQDKESYLHKEALPTSHLAFCRPSCVLTYLTHFWKSHIWISDLFTNQFRKFHPELPEPQVLQHPDYLTTFSGFPGITPAQYHQLDQVVLVENGSCSQVPMNQHTMQEVVKVAWETSNADRDEETKMNADLELAQIFAVDQPTTLQPRTADEESRPVEAEVSETMDVVGDLDPDVTRLRCRYLKKQTPKFFPVPRNSCQQLDPNSWKTQEIGRKRMPVGGTDETCPVAPETDRLSTEVHNEFSCVVGTSPSSVKGRETLENNSVPTEDLELAKKKETEETGGKVQESEDHPMEAEEDGWSVPDAEVIGLEVIHSSF